MPTEQTSFLSSAQSETGRSYTEAQLAVLISDAGIDQTLALDTAMNIISWNGACAQHTGISREEAIGKPFATVQRTAAALPAIAEALTMALRGFRSFVPWEQGSFDGRFYEQHFMPLKDNQGEVIGILNVLHDVAHRIKADEAMKRLNKELYNKNKELKHRTEELANFNWIASHDLKEPLRKIYTFIEMVASKEGHKLSDVARGNLRRAQSAVQRMGLLTDDIVTFSEAAVPNEQAAPTDLQKVLEISLKKHQKAIDDWGAKIVTSDLPVIVAYPLMQQHLWNHMLGNALKFHLEGAKPAVSVAYAHISGKDVTEPEADPNLFYHCLSFTDNGIGFAPEHSEKIFAMFQRLHPQGTFKGTGMGLAICRKIAEAQAGFIKVESTEGSGSTFTVYLADMSGYDQIG